MDKIKISFILIISVVISPWLAYAGPAGPQAAKITLANGLTLIHKENRSNDIVAVDVFIKAGTGVESDTAAGITNFLQGLLLKGTATRTAEQLASEVESMGGILEADTEEDYAELYLIITRENFDRGLEILADVLTKPALVAEEIEKNRNILLSQIKAKQDSIFPTAYDLFNEALYGKYPYHKPAGGTEQTISSISRQDLINFHRKFYTPENMVVVVVGNVKKNTAVKKIAKIFNTGENSVSANKITGENKPPEISPDELLPQRQTYYEQAYRRKFKQAYLMLGYILPEGASPDYPALKVINAVLGGGMGSRLFVNLRDQEGLAYEIGSFYPTRILKSKFVIYLGLDAKNIVKARTKILRELEKLKEQPLSEKELKDIKNYLKGTFILGHQTNKEQAWYLGWYEIIGKGYLYDNLYPRELEKVSAEDIIRTAGKYFQDTNWTAVEIIPEGSLGDE